MRYDATDVIRTEWNRKSHAAQPRADVPQRHRAAGGGRSRETNRASARPSAECVEHPPLAERGLGVPVAGTEQYPQGLGPTVRELADKMGDRPAKVAFSCAACGEIFQRWQESRITRVLVAGIESHVCIQQTVLDLLAAGYRVYVAVDAIGARHAIDHETALRRMEASGAILTTTESAMFEWCQEAGTPQFKEISRLVRESPPSEIA
jgi:hypothetical protein